MLDKKYQDFEFDNDHLRVVIHDDSNEVDLFAHSFDEESVITLLPDDAVEMALDILKAVRPGHTFKT